MNNISYGNYIKTIFPPQSISNVPEGFNISKLERPQKTKVIQLITAIQSTKHLKISILHFIGADEKKYNKKNG